MTLMPLTPFDITILSAVALYLLILKQRKRQRTKKHLWYDVPCEMSALNLKNWMLKAGYPLGKVMCEQNNSQTASLTGHWAFSYATPNICNLHVTDKCSFSPERVIVHHSVSALGKRLHAAERLIRTWLSTCSCLRHEHNAGMWQFSKSFPHSCSHSLSIDRLISQHTNLAALRYFL